MNPAKRLSLELSQLRAVLPAPAFRSYCYALAGRGLSIARARTLVPADKAMRGTVQFNAGPGGVINIPLDAVNPLLKGLDETPTFGGAREMYASRVYLRGFRPGLKSEAALDLGSNRGLFLMQAAKVLGAHTLIGVEPQSIFTPVFAAIASANGLSGKDYTRYERFAGSKPAPATITIGEIMTAHGLDKIGFMKCDIEGGEFDVFLNDGSFLPRIDNIAMELHPEKGDVRQLVAKLADNGFKVRVCDQFGGSIAPERGHYLYGSRTGDLA